MDADDRERRYVEVIQPYKAALEVWYACHRNLWIDIKLVFLTLLSVAVPSLNPTRYFPSVPTPSEALRDAMK